MKRLPLLSVELEALLAPHRTVEPLAPSVEARAVARAVASVRSLEEGAGLASGRPRWVFAVAAGAVLALGAGAYAARGWQGWQGWQGWIVPPSSPAAPPVVPLAAPVASVPRAPAVVRATPDTEAPETLAPAVPHTRRIAGRPSTARPTNAELQLLRAARQSVTRGDFAGALAVIAEHVRRFRNGSLVEEREALRVKSLAGLGRREEAQRAAAAFHARFPHSVFLSTFSTFELTREADR